MTRMIRILCVGLLTLVGLVSSSLPVRADDDKHARCEKRIEEAQAKLQDAIQKHGEDSKEARKRRDELEQVKRDCPDMDHHDDHDHDQPH
jgi:hypothetical protein